MFDLIEYKLKISENNRKILKKGNNIIIGVLFFMCSVLIWDGYAMIFNHRLSSLCLIGIGMIMGNVLWMFIELLKNYAEIDSENIAIEHFKTIQREENYLNAMKSFKEAEEKYKSFKFNN